MARKLLCKECRSANIQKIDDGMTKRVSKGKMGLAAATGGASLLFTGARKKTRGQQFHCRDCGNVWIIK